MRVNLGDKENIEPNLAPLLDCIFLLLIFFLVATTFDKKEQQQDEVQQLNISLPESKAALSPLTVLSDPFVLGVDRHGKYYLAGKRVDVKQLHQAIKQQAQANPQRQVRIDGDKNTPLQYLVYLLDLCEFEGLTNIGVRARADQ